MVYMCIPEPNIRQHGINGLSLYKIKKKRKEKSVKVLFKTKEKYLCVVNSFHSAPICEIQTRISSKISLKD